jgi:hypothetical protein
VLLLKLVFDSIRNDQILHLCLPIVYTKQSALFSTSPYRLNHRPKHRIHLHEALHKPDKVDAPLGFVFIRAAQSTGGNAASIEQSALLFVRRAVRYLTIKLIAWADHCVAGFGPLLWAKQSNSPHPMLGCHQLKVGQTQRIGQRVEVVLLRQPRREVVGFVLTGFAQGDAFEFAEGYFHELIIKLFDIRL